LKVRYCLHPLCGEEVRVFRFHKSRIIHVKTADGDERGLPLWMTDEKYCQKVVFSSVPSCSIDALMQLRRFVDHYIANK